VKLGNPNLAAIRGSGGEAGKAEADRFANTADHRSGSEGWRLDTAADR
jgi:hypothetical protein